MRKPSAVRAPCVFNGAAVLVVLLDAADGNWIFFNYEYLPEDNINLFIEERLHEMNWGLITNRTKNKRFCCPECHTKDAIAV